MSVAIEGGPERKLAREPDGYFSGTVEDAHPGSLYRYRLDGGKVYPDPASRFQPGGPHGPSLIVDPSAYEWTDAGWRGVPLEGQVIYELHIGTFTREGTWQAARRQLAELARLGVTIVETMPVAEFTGNFGWGYDGVDLFAPTRLYGQPDDFRGFVDHAHSLGVGVILDVVYNHFGPDGNYVGEYSPYYFTDRYETDWGDAINYDGDHSGPVREFFTSNARYWIDEYHLDGLRLDATQNIYDFSGGEHILAAISRSVRDGARGRSTFVVGENEPQNTILLRPHSAGGYGLDALWNDDLHHSLMVAMTGHNEGYYGDYLGAPQEFVSAAKYGYLYQGQWYEWQEQVRGTPSYGLPPAAFVTFLQNHDQVANSGRGQRCHELTSPGRYKALTAYILLSPGTPMLFQGEEFASSSPFLFFADHSGEIAGLVRKGREEFLSQWPSLKLPEMVACFADPCSSETFERCKLDFAERERHSEIYKLHADLLRLRRVDPVFRAQRPGGLDGAVIGPEAFVLRFFGDRNDDRLLLVNLGTDLNRIPAPEPLLAPPYEMDWTKLWSSEDPDYGGCGTQPVGSGAAWKIPGHCAVVLKPIAGAKRDFMPKRKEKDR